MAVNQEIRNMLPDGAIVLDNMSYDNSIIGTTFDGRVIYDYDNMVMELMNDEGWSFEEAVDWLEYNTIRSLGYMGDKAPVVVSSVWN